MYTIHVHVHYTCTCTHLDYTIPHKYTKVCWLGDQPLPSTWEIMNLYKKMIHVNNYNTCTTLLHVYMYMYMHTVYCTRTVFNH